LKHIKQREKLEKRKIVNKNDKIVLTELIPQNS
jgi:hypothetical protein